MFLVCAVPIYLLAAAFTRVTLVPDTGLDYGILAVLILWILVAASRSRHMDLAFDEFDRHEDDPWVRGIYREAFRDAMRAGAASPEVAHRSAVEIAMRAKYDPNRRPYTGRA
jgi:hypothetical protein